MEKLVSNVMNLPSRQFWTDKNVLVTGHTGFKGAWLTYCLQKLGAKVTGIALEPEGERSLFTALDAQAWCAHHIVDINQADVVREVFSSSRPEIVIHLAAQALVRRSYQAPVNTFATNVLGTAHVLQACLETDTTKVVVAITTDKVYDNPEHNLPFNESDSLGGHDPYSASKAASEMVIESYRKSFFLKRGIALSSARAGNVIGGGDWSQDRLIPDAVRAWHAGQPVKIRNPNAIRPWQHVIEPLMAYLRLAEMSWENPMLAGPYNFGPEVTANIQVLDVLNLSRQHFGQGGILLETQSDQPHEAQHLRLNTQKAQQVLGVLPVWDAEKTIQYTMDWYRNHLKGASALDCCQKDWDQYMADHLHMQS